MQASFRCGGHAARAHTPPINSRARKSNGPLAHARSALLPRTHPLGTDKPPAFLEEAAGPRYVVEVDVDAPAGSLDDAAALEPGARAMALPGPGGARYTCIIPPPPPPPPATGGSDGGGGGDTAAAAASTAPSPAALVASLDGTCLYRMEDWWTYEFCAGKHARQFHREGDGPGGVPGPVVSEFILGRWNETDAVDPVPRSDPGGGAPEEEVAYLSQEYGHGQPCDLTGAARGVEVRYVCADGGGGGGSSGANVATGRGTALDGVPPPTGPRDALLAVREPATCRYTFTVAVADLCAHPPFRRAEPPTLVVRCALQGGEGGGVGGA